MTAGVTAPLANSTWWLESEAWSVMSLNYSLPVMVALAVLLSGVIVTTAFGNVLVFVALWRYRHLQTVSNYFIGNLALSDLMLATTVLPLSTVNECLGHWVFGRLACNVWLCTDVLCCTASIWNLCVIAVDRYTATLHPVWYREKRSGRQAAVFICAVWVLSAAICLPPLLGWGNELHFAYDVGTRVHHCTLFQAPSYVVFSASGSFFIPFFVTAFLYLRIFAVLRQRVRKMRYATSPTYRLQARHRRHVTVTPTAASITADECHSTASRLEHHLHKSSRVMLIPAIVTDDIGMGVLREADAGDDEDEEDCDDEDSISRLSPSEQQQQQQQRSTSGTRSTSDCDSPSPYDKRVSVFTATTASTPISGTCSPNTIMKTAGRRGPQPNRGEYVMVAEHDDMTADDDDVIARVRRQNSCGRRTRDGSSAPSSATPTTPKRSSLRRRPAQTQTDGSGQATASGKDNGSVGGGSRRSRMESLRKRIRRMSSTLRRRTLSRFSSLQKGRQEQRETRATLRMAIIIAFFCGMWLGFFATYVVRGLCGDACRLPRQLEATFFWLGYANSCINPVLYAIFNDDFRKAFRNILGCASRRRPQRHMRHVRQRRV